LNKEAFRPFIKHPGSKFKTPKEKVLNVCEAKFKEEKEQFEVLSERVYWKSGACADQCRQKHDR